MMKKKKNDLIIFDIDETIFYNLEKPMRFLKKEVEKCAKECHLAIASHSYSQRIVKVLEEYGVLNLFMYICGDFRDKHHMVHDILEKYELKFGKKPDKVIFVDNMSFNLNNVKKHFPEIMCKYPSEFFDIRSLGIEKSEPYSC